MAHPALIMVPFGSASPGHPVLIPGLVFVRLNQFLVGLVVKLARGQNFAEMGVPGFLLLFLDFTVLSMGSVTVLSGRSILLASLLHILPLFLLDQALRVPAWLRQVQEL